MLQVYAHIINSAVTSSTGTVTSADPYSTSEASKVWLTVAYCMCCAEIIQGLHPTFGLGTWDCCKKGLTITNGANSHGYHAFTDRYGASQKCPMQ